MMIMMMIVTVTRKEEVGEEDKFAFAMGWDVEGHFSKKSRSIPLYWTSFDDADN